MEKPFNIEQGGTITWNGNPLEAIIDIQATYKVKAALYPLLLLEDPEYKNRIPIECRLFLTDKLMSPNIVYDIYLPNADQDTRSKVYNALNSDEEKSKQFLSLLVLNSFTNTNTSTNTGTSSIGYNAAGVTGIEFLSNQLSRMLSQASKDFDIGFNYRPSDAVTTQQIEVALSTQLLNDRVIINGNFDAGGTQVESKNAKNIVEGEVEVKLTNNGKLRAKAYNHANDNLTNELSPYTQGVGISYKEDFNSFSELLKHYYEIIFTRKDNKTHPVEDSKGESNNNGSK
jgi:hypothetical protein